MFGPLMLLSALLFFALMIALLFELWREGR